MYWSFIPAFVVSIPKADMVGWATAMKPAHTHSLTAHVIFLADDKFLKMPGFLTRKRRSPAPTVLRSPARPSKRKQWGEESMVAAMKSTKVQNPRCILLHALRRESCELCQCACVEIGHASRCSCNTWCCQFSLQQGLAALFWLNVTD